MVIKYIFKGFVSGGIVFLKVKRLKYIIELLL